MIFESKIAQEIYEQTEGTFEERMKACMYALSDGEALEYLGATQEQAEEAYHEVVEKAETIRRMKAIEGELGAADSYDPLNSVRHYMRILHKLCTGEDVEAVEQAKGVVVRVNPLEIQGIKEAVEHAYDNIIMHGQASIAIDVVEDKEC